MGMSASQARLLSLTARLSDLELQAQSISNSKIRLAQQTEQAATEYTNALDKKTLTVMSGVDAKSGTYQYIDASAYNLTTYNAVSNVDKQRFIQDNQGKILVTGKVGSAFDSAGGNVNTFLANLGYAPDAQSTVQKTTYSKTYVLDANDGKQPAEWANAVLITRVATDPVKQTMTFVCDFEQTKNLTYDSGAVTYYTNVFNEIAANGYNAPGDANMKDTDWLHSQLVAGNVSLVEWEEQGGNVGSGGFDPVSWTSDDASLKETTDEAVLTRAEAKYNTELAAIQVKDKTFDLELKNIDTEHNAIQTEIESVKKVIDKNIERTFKIFNA